MPEHAGTYTKMIIIILYLLCILQYSTVLTASLYELQLISLTVTNPYSKSGFFEISLTESSDEDLLSSLVSTDAESCMISTSSVQKSMTAYNNYYIIS